MNFSAAFRIFFLFSVAAPGFTFAQNPSVDTGGIINAASFVPGQPVAPGSIVAIFGKQLASGLTQADSVPWSTSRNNVSVSFNGVAAPIQFVSPTQINAQVPWEVLATGTGTATVVVNNNGATSAASTVVVNPIVPGVFQFSGHGLAVNVTDPTSARYGTIAAPAGSIAGLTTFPAQVNDFLFFYATGLGPLDSPVQDGHDSSDKIRNVVTVPTVLVGNAPAKVLFAGLSPGYPGIYQVNISVPQVAAGSAVAFQVQSGGFTSPDTTTIAIQ
ncbi:MAG: IPT/TIG domain-containing protein [Acidobacteriota bacterium]